VILFVSLAACSGKDPADKTLPSIHSDVALEPTLLTDADFDTSGDIVMKTDQEVYGTDSQEISFTITNSSSKETGHGNFDIEVWLNDQWYRIRYLKGAVSIYADFMPLAPASAGTQKISLAFLERFLGYPLAEGKYRIVMNSGREQGITEERDGKEFINNPDGKWYCAEFRVDESKNEYQPLEKLPKKYSPGKAAANGDVVIQDGVVENAGKIIEFLERARESTHALLRITKFTADGDAVIADCVFERNDLWYETGWFKYRVDSSRDRSAGSGRGITERVYSCLNTDGQNIYLSNCAGWELLEAYPNAAAEQLVPGVDPETAQAAGQLAAARMEEDHIHYRVFSPGGDKAITFAGADMAAMFGRGVTYGYEAKWNDIFKPDVSSVLRVSIRTVSPQKPWTRSGSTMIAMSSSPQRPGICNTMRSSAAQNICPATARAMRSITGSLRSLNNASPGSGTPGGRVLHPAGSPAVFIQPSRRLDSLGGLEPQFCHGVLPHLVL
jgi:hypothetical protein